MGLFGSLGGHRGRKGEASKTSVLLKENHVFSGSEASRARPDAEKTCPETDPENKSENRLFFYDFGSQTGAKTVNTSIQSSIVF